MAHLPLLSMAPGNNDPSQILATLNAQIAANNAALPGLVASLTAALATSGTAANTMLAYTLLKGSLAQGQGLRMRIWGFNAADANVRTVTFNFGTSAATVLVTASAALWWAECVVFNVGTVASPVQSIAAWGVQGITPVVSSQPASAQDITTLNTAITIQLTTATSGITTANGAHIEQIK